ncbi:hypothetical protein [Methylobacterium cerastii]|uniref:hypothetical protein n=1 Tax=Methylobacterium cerastii TaxID=932741 RepID=UPI001EE214EA|nr:hypothetical protein [Methylobacterium cerastii]
MFDRRAGIAGAYSPNQSMTAVNANNATTLRTNAADNARALQTNNADNQSKLAIAYAAPVTAKEGETVYLSQQTSAATGLPRTVSGAFTLKPDQKSVLPDGRELQGNESPPSLEQAKAADYGRMTPELRQAIVFGSTPTPSVQGANGPVITTAPQSIGQAPAPAAVAPSNVSRLQAERAALQAHDPNDPRVAELSSAIAADGRGATPDAYRDTSDRALATRHDEIAKAGAAAGAMNGNLDRLEGLLSDVPTGALADRKLQVARYAQDLGLGDVASSLTGGKLDQAQAANAIVQRLAPGLRVPGSGAQSDRELKNFIDSLPSLGNTPGGNRIIVETLRAAARQQQQAAEIARQSQAGTLDKYEADRRIAALSSPFARFAGGTADATSSTPGASSAAVSRAAAPVQVSSPAEARRLPSGTEIILPDGTTGRVP